MTNTKATLQKLKESRMKPNIDRLKSITDEMMFTLAEAATMCGVTAAGVRSWAIKGQIKLVRVGSRFYVTGAELRKAVEV
jgi:hypothetical protein